nr:putative nucleotidyltransferase, ribonuclease H [Tanacetum cinerariifolium]
KEDNEIWTIVENLEKQVGGDFSTRDRTITRYSINNHIRQRPTFRVSFLERFAEGLGNQAYVQYCLSSSDRRKCRAPICWDQVGERVVEGPEMIEVTNEKVAVAKEKLKEARNRQKSYADKHRKSLEFQPGDHVFLKVSPV